MRNLIPALVSTFNIRQQHDAVIKWIIPGPPSEKADLQRRDVVIAVFGQPVDSTTKLQNRIALMQMGGLVGLDILRDGKEINIKARLSKPLAAIRHIQKY
ncbi:MAG: PDZ domain-containing protein [Methylococcaceae bacterium]